MYNKIFLSHSSQDKMYGDAIVSLLLQIGLDAKQILYSSNPNCGIPIGCDIFEYLRSTIQNESTYMIYLLSENYYNSIACMNEMGAAWVQQKEFLMIAVPDFNFSDSRFQSGAANPRKLAVSIENKIRMQQFIDHIVHLFQIRLDSIEKQNCLQKFFQQLQTIPKPKTSNKTPVTADDFIKLGKKLETQDKNYPAAIQQYLYAIYLDSYCTSAYSQIVETATLQKDYLRAQKVSDEFIERFPENADAYGSRGYLLYAEKKYSESIAYCDKAISLGHNRWFYNTRGRALLGQNKLYDAIMDFWEAHRLDPKYEPAVKNLQKICKLIGIDELLDMSMIKNKQGDKELCRVYAQSVLLVDQNNKKAKEILEGLSK